MSARKVVMLLLALATALVLFVVTPARSRAEDRLLGQRLKDAAITALVKAKLVAARPANATDVDVDTREGVLAPTG
jgi:osmotically-inducible protein OsmY